MTMNVAGALAVVLCLTVTSGQQELLKNPNLLSISEPSFTTESNSEIGITKNEITLVTSPYEANVVIDETSVVTVEAETIEETIKEKEYSNRWNIELTEEEIDLLAKILWVEARGETEAGQQAVVEVIFNRMVSEEFPDTLYDVLSQKNPVQFASWKLRHTAEPTENEYEIIYKVLNGQTSVVKKDTLYFATKKLTRNLDIKIGGHYFCY